MGLLLEERKVKKEDMMSPIRTLCRDCIFATWIGQNQSGCQFARLERFAANGGIKKISFKWMSYQDAEKEAMEYWGDINTLDIDEFTKNKWVLAEYHDNVIVSYDEDNIRNSLDELDYSLELSYYVIPERFCNYCRDANWAITQKNVDVKQAVVDENKFEFTWLIYIDSKWSNLHLMNITSQLRNSPNSNIILVDNKSNLSDEEVTNLLNHTNLPWRRVYMAQDKAPMNFALDESYKYIETQFFGQITASVPLPKEPALLIEELDITINQRLERMLVAKYKNNGFTTFYTKAARLMSGNAGIQFYKDNKTVEGLLNKIQYMCNEQNNQFLIKEYE